jgi:tetratricopeptide (TPR) repeat protein
LTTSVQPQATIDRRFLLLHEHKRGGMGTIWKARDLVTGQPIALKILHEAGGGQSERFVREGALLAELHHPGVVAYVGHGLTGSGAPFLAMAWLEGETLAERLARQPLSPADSLVLARAVLRGLQVVHGRGIVHRDLKPSNLFLRQGRLDDVVLLDLGIARQLDVSSDLTRTGSILGTPSYMAPEQAQGHHDLRPAADLFSLGCVLHECLTGDVPFAGSHVFSVLAKVLFEEPRRLRELRPELPEALETLVADLLIKDPARRPADVRTVLARLNAIQVGSEGPPTRTVSLPRPRGEQELVSVILATRAGAPAGPPEGTARWPADEADLPELSVFGAEPRRLADGSAIITLGQQGGAATDLAGRAARCALRLQGSRPAWGFVLATGRGIPGQGVPIGEAVDRAGTLLRALGPRADGSIWLDEVSAGLLDARFATSRVEEVEGLFLLTGEDPSVDPGRRLLGRPTTCVGREHELGMLDLALRACIDEASPRALLVLGPAGIGKSRLRHELLRRAQLREEPPTTLLGLGDPIRTTGRGLLGTALARLCDLRDDLPDGQKRAALEARIGRHLPADGDGRRTIVFLAELCGLPYPADELPELRAARQTPGIMADQLTQAWLAFLRAEAARAPLLLVLDDLQWSDARSISLVGAALRALTASPLMVLALGRPETPDLFPELWAPRLTTLPLQPLPRAATARLIRQVLGSEVSDDSVERIVDRAGGNALYLEELIRAAEGHRDAIPGTVLAMLQARIGLLAPGPRRVLRAASVFGEDFPLAGVEALLAADGAADELQPALATLSRHEILERQGPEGSAARGRFRHALMRDAAYGLCAAEELAAAHALAARALESRGEDRAVVAAHYERAGQPQAAIPHLIAAADQAFRDSDLAGAVALVERGVACGATGVDLGVLRSIEASARFYRNEIAIGETACRQALELLPVGHPKQAFNVACYIYMGLHLGNWDQVAGQVDQLLALDPADGGRPEYVRGLGDVLISHVVLGNRAGARRLLDRVVELDAVAGAGDPLTHGHALYWRLRSEEMIGDDPYQAWLWAREGVDCYRRSGDRRMLAYTQVELGECTRRLFSLPEGMAIMRQAMALARDLREAITSAFVTQYLASALAEQGTDDQQPEARALAQEVIALGSGAVYGAFGWMALAQVELRAGDLAAAEDVARQAHDRFHQMGLASYFPHVDGTLLKVRLAQGDPAGAAALADQILRQLDEQGPFGLVEPPARLLAARAHLAAGRRDDAAAGLRRALRQLTRRNASLPDPTLRARVLTDVPEHAALTALARELGVDNDG